MESQRHRGRPRLDSGAIQERRERCYSLHLMGFSEAEIARNIGIDKAAVHRHVEIVRHNGYWADKPSKQRFGDLLQIVLDGTMLTVKEAWKLYHSPANSNRLMLRAALLGRVQAGMSLLSEFIPNAETIMFEEDLAKVVAESDELKQKMKILPIEGS